MGKGVEWTFFREDIRVAKETQHEVTTLLTIKEIQIKTTLRYDFIVMKIDFI